MIIKTIKKPMKPIAFYTVILEMFEGGLNSTSKLQNSNCLHKIYSHDPDGQ